MRKHISILAVLLAIAACTHTKLVQTWSDPENKTVYKSILVVGVSDSEQTRRAYESYFVSNLQKHGVAATASYKLISHKDDMAIDGEKAAFENIIKKVVKGGDVDAALVTHLVNIEENAIYHNYPTYGSAYGPAYGPQYYTAAYYSDVHGYHEYVSNYALQPGYISEEDTYVLESSLFDVKTEELIWTTRSKTFAPDSIDEAIKDVTDLIIADLNSKHVI